MYQRDYILRMIEMLAQLIAGILRLIKSGQLSQASQALQSAYGIAFKHESLNLKAIPEEELIDILLKQNNYNTGHLEMLAELFFAEAELLLAEKKVSDSMLFYRKSLTLFEHIDCEYKSYSQDRVDKMQAIKEMLAQEGLKI